MKIKSHYHKKQHFMMMKTNSIQTIHNFLISLGLIILFITPLSVFGQDNNPLTSADTTATIQTFKGPKSIEMNAEIDVLPYLIKVK